MIVRIVPQHVRECGRSHVVRSRGCDVHVSSANADNHTSSGRVGVMFTYAHQRIRSATNLLRVTQGAKHTAPCGRQPPVSTGLASARTRTPTFLLSFCDLAKTVPRIALKIISQLLGGGEHIFCTRDFFRQERKPPHPSCCFLFL